MGIILAGGAFLLIGLVIIIISFFVQDLWIRKKVYALDVRQRHHTHNMPILLALICLALAYSTLFHQLYDLTGSALTDGCIGVAFGLYICSYPAANALDMLFFERNLLHRLSDWSVVGWILLNLLTLLAGWLVLFIGVIRLVENAAEMSH